KSLCLELFGSRNASAVVDLPAYLQHFAKTLPSNECYTPKLLIQNHTLFPYYRPFLELERATIIERQMSGLNAAGVYLKVGLAASRVRTVKYLQYCPLCVKDDIDKYGETYWHRTHQLPSVIACSTHRIYLEQSSVNTYCSPHQHQFIPASKVISDSTKPRFLDNSYKDLLSFKLAQISGELLEKNFPATAKDWLLNKYLRLLIDRGLASYSLSLRARKLETEFLHFYPPEFLSEFRCDLTKTGNSSKGNWLLHLLRKKQSNAKHPLHHLLLLLFLNTTVNDFFNLPDEISFFGAPPWQCLNKAAPHYKQFVVTDFRLGARCRNSKPVGIFKCDCGFEFARSGPDSNPEDKFRIDKIINFGDVWKTELIRLWNIPKLNLSEISRRLGVDPLTVKRYANYIGLSFKRGLKSYRTLNDNNQLKISPDNSFQTEEAKAEWLKLLKQSTDISLKELREQNSRLYSWLFIHESEWLKANLPQKPKSEKISNTSVNWKERDQKLAENIQKTAQKLIENQARPKRITKTAIGKEANCLSLLLVKLDKLPLTAMALEKVVETTASFAIRRIHWAANYLNENHIPVTYWNLIEKACVFKLKDNLLVNQALLEEIYDTGHIQKHCPKLSSPDIHYSN
ncbi:MAG: TnsD family transposase, partial [Acidobacteriota bacterium]|nr:TnsD family transposase [Acidobacteriota bacterium]